MTKVAECQIHCSACTRSGRAGRGSCAKTAIAWVRFGSRARTAADGEKKLMRPNGDIYVGAVVPQVWFQRIDVGFTRNKSQV
jgi:hypothetical protein